MSEERGGYGQCLTCFWQLGKTEFKRKKINLNATSNLYASVFSAYFLVKAEPFFVATVIDETHPQKKWKFASLEKVALKVLGGPS